MWDGFGLPFQYLLLFFSSMTWMIFWLLVIIGVMPNVLQKVQLLVPEVCLNQPLESTGGKHLVLSGEWEGGFI